MNFKRLRSRFYTAAASRIVLGHGGASIWHGGECAEQLRFGFVAMQDLPPLFLVGYPVLRRLVCKIRRISTRRCAALKRYTST